MTSIDPDRSSYALRRRLRRRKGGTPLGGFALDLVVRFDAEGAAFVQDLNGNRNVMSFADVTDLLMWLAPEIKRVHDEHFAPPGPDWSAGDGLDQGQRPTAERPVSGSST